MPDYKKLYTNLFRATEEAINLLIAAQRECEEMYISSPDPEIKLIPLEQKTKNEPDGS